VFTVQCAIGFGVSNYWLISKTANWPLVIAINKSDVVALELRTFQKNRQVGVYDYVFQEFVFFLSVLFMEHCLEMYQYNNIFLNDEICS